MHIPKILRPFSRTRRAAAALAPTAGDRPRTVIEATRPDSLGGPAQASGEPFGPIEPRRVGHFVLLEPLGAGAMGVVWAAFDERLDRRVAIKLLKSRSSGANDRLLREAQALARLAHPNVVSVYEVGELAEGEVFMAMELVAGVTLRSWQRAPDRPWTEILDAYTAAGEGLAAAHREGIVHRDFKPDNVLIDAAGRARVVDFGLARETFGTPPQAGASGAAGTPGYMAPEQFTGAAVDARADQFAFSAALYEALYGRRPYPDLAFASPDPDRALRPERPSDPRARWLWEALERGLAFEPEDRHTSMDALLAVLTRDHNRARRMWLAATAVIGVAALAGASALFVQERASRCATSASELAGVWDDALEARVKQAFLDTKLPQAAELWAATSARLDAYSARWSSARREACEDTHVRGVQSAELLDRRMECLAARKRTLGATVEVFAEHPARAAAKSADLFDGLGELETCSDPIVLRLGLPPPRDSAAVGELEISRRHLAEVEALLAAGELARAVSELDAASVLDTRLAYAPAHAELLRVRGVLEIRQGHLARGEASLLEALSAAMASRHDELAAAVWVTLAREAGPSHHPLDASKEWVHLGDAWLERLGDRDDRRRLELELARGLIEAASGAHATAAEIFTRAIESRPAERAGELRLVALLRARAISLAATGRAELALADYRRALEINLRAWGPHHPDGAITRRALGVLLIEQLGRADEGKREIEEAEADFLATLGESSPEIAHCEHALSQAAMFKGDYAGALRHSERADQLFEKTLGAEHRRRGETLVAIGVLRFMLEDYRGSLEAYEKGRAILESNLGTEHIDVGVLASNIGETLLALGEPAAAAERFERALAILRHGLGPTHRDLALPLKGLGLAKLAHGRRAEARTSFEEALAIMEKAGGGDPRELAEVRWALARSLERTGAAGERRQKLAHLALEGFRGLGAAGKETARAIEGDLLVR